MLDTGATNNFVSPAMVDHLGLEVAKSPCQVKAVNSRAQNIQGITTCMFKIGTWQQECQFLVLSLDDFDFILGMEFFVRAKAVAMPHLGGLLIADECCPSFIPVERGQVAERHARQAVSQVKSGVERRETTIAALVVVKPDQVVRGPDRVAAVREEHCDVMPAEKSWVLPPRRADEGRIERGARPLARDPYRKALLSERAVWKKQPGVLLAAVNQPSKFQRKRDGVPLDAIKWMGKVAYLFKLPGRRRFHPTFHESFLKPYVEKADHGRQRVRRAQWFERHVDHRTKRASRTGRRLDYLMRWEGSSEAQATWADNAVLWQFEDRIGEYAETLPTRTSASSGGGGFVTPL